MSSKEVAVYRSDRGELVYRLLKRAALPTHACIEDRLHRVGQPLLVGAEV